MVASTSQPAEQAVARLIELARSGEQTRQSLLLAASELRDQLSRQAAVLARRHGRGDDETTGSAYDHVLKQRALIDNLIGILNEMEDADARNSDTSRTK